MVAINFTFTPSKIDLQKIALQQSSGFVWLKGNVMFFQKKSVIILEDVPVVDLLFELLNKIVAIKNEEVASVLATDDVNYDLSLRKKGEYLTIVPNWGYDTGNISIETDGLDDFVDELRQVMKNAYKINCVLLPEAEGVVLTENQ
jgi:hypothetical protein